MKKFTKKVILFLFLVVFPGFSILLAQDFTGRWEGALTHAGSKYRIIFSIEQQNQQLKASLDVPDQGARGIPVESAKLQNDSLYMIIPSIGATYSCRLSQNSEKLEGQWKQGGISLPLIMEKSTEEAMLRRPQLPVEPYAYHTEDISFPNKEAGIILSGTFSRPKGEGQYPAIILVSGSGPQDRDETILDHKPFLVLANHLSQNGFAVLRYDDRGFGRSTGNFTTATTEDFARDAVAAFNYLQDRPDVQAKQIGLIGHSEGGIIAPLVGAEKPLAYLVLLAPPVLPGYETLILQGETLLKKQGNSEADLKNYRNIQQQILDIIRLESDMEKAGTQLKKLLQTQYDSLPEEVRKANPDPTAGISAQLAQLLSPWFRYYVAYNPSASFTKINSPVLALFGSKDLQVPAKENAAALQAILTKSKKTNYEIEVMEGLNHLFQSANTGLPIEYNQIENTIAPEVLERISEWIKQQLPTSVE